MSFAIDQSDPEPDRKGGEHYCLTGSKKVGSLNAGVALPRRRLYEKYLVPIRRWTALHIMEPRSDVLRPVPDNRPDPVTFLVAEEGGGKAVTLGGFNLLPA